MEAVNVSGLKNNPSEALRLAHKDVVVVMNRDKPDALMVGIENMGILGEKGVRPALATALFRDGHLSLVRAARVAEMSVPRFVSHVSRLGIPVVKLEGAEARHIVIPLRTRTLEMDGLPFIRKWTIPNFYFHLTTTYALLRGVGVDIGKQDFLGGY